MFWFFVLVRNAFGVFFLWARFSLRTKRSNFSATGDGDAALFWSPGGFTSDMFVCRPVLLYGGFHKKRHACLCSGGEAMAACLRACRPTADCISRAFIEGCIGHDPGSTKLFNSIDRAFDRRFFGKINYDGKKVKRDRFGSIWKNERIKKKKMSDRKVSQNLSLQASRDTSIARVLRVRTVYQ